MSELERPGIDGRIIKDGIAQSTETGGDVTRIRLSIFGDLAPGRSSYGPVIEVKLPEPVTVPGGTFVSVEMEWLPGPEREEASQPMRVASDAVITKAYSAPSLLGPGHVQGVIA